MKKGVTKAYMIRETPQRGGTRQIQPLQPDPEAAAWASLSRRQLEQAVASSTAAQLVDSDAYKPEDSGVCQCFLMLRLCGRVAASRLVVGLS